MGTDDGTGEAPLALFGGTFDPVHSAHIDCARAVSRALDGAPVHMLPNAVPPHRPPPGAAAEHRLAMLEQACAPFPELRIDTRELERQGPSRTRDTLAELRKEHPQRPLVFILGSDSLADLDQWYCWEAFPSLCHLAVVPRPGAPAAPTRVLEAFPEADAAVVRRQPSGRRLMLAGPRLECSATEIREELARRGDSRHLPTEVLDYIHRHRLYNVAQSN